MLDAEKHVKADFIAVFSPLEIGIPIIFHPFLPGELCGNTVISRKEMVGENKSAQAEITAGIDLRYYIAGGTAAAFL